jgi:23S rRNA maturation-related 3'-5' exoribonuclease YhaM
MAKIIDLDALMPEKYLIRLDGKEHDLSATTTEMYLKVLKTKKKLGAADDEVTQVETSIDLIVLALPTVNRERLMKLPVPLLMKITEAIDAQMEMMTSDKDEVAEGEAGE